MSLYSFCLLFPGYHSYFRNYFQMLYAANMFRWPPNVTGEDLNLNLNSLLVKHQIDNPSPGAVTGGN